MNKIFLLLAVSLGFTSASFAQQLSVTPNGMIVNFGSLQVARERMQMLPGTLKIGSTVVTVAGSVGQVVGINPVTRQIIVQINYVNYTYNMNDLAVTNGCGPFFCVNEDVITRAGVHGTVQGLFNDGRIAVQVNYVNYVYSFDQLAMTNACTYYYCTGDNVITNTGANGTVAGIFSDSSLAVEVNYVIYSEPLASLAMTKAICANIYINRVGYCN